MVKVIIPKFQFITYRYRFLLLYVMFGALSLVVELFITRALMSFGFRYSIGAGVGLIAGILLAFVLNTRFNFKIAKGKIKRALFYFSAISLGAFSFQIIIRKYLIEFGISMDLSRFLIAGTFFIVSYIIHRRVTFKEYKKVGVAIYADGVEDIKKIHEKISEVCDFIHIDIVDDTYKKDCGDIKAYRAEVVRAYWEKKEIEVHIMSRTPSLYLKDLLPHVDTIYVHTDIDENISDVLAKIRNGGCNPGLAVSLRERLNDIYPYLDMINDVLLLAINNPGYSGQKFDIGIMQWIKELDKRKDRNNFKICVDGGVNNETIKLLNVEKVVSGSFVLNAKDPIKQIMYLQTSGEYDEY